MSCEGPLRCVSLLRRRLTMTDDTKSIDEGGIWREIFLFGGKSSTLSHWREPASAHEYHPYKYEYFVGVQTMYESKKYCSDLHAVFGIDL
jgi:hypothetical protein